VNDVVSRKSDTTDFVSRISSNSGRKTDSGLVAGPTKTEPKRRKTRQNTGFIKEPGI